MAIYIALLRGINVGGKNIIKMDALKKTFASLGFGQVQTYIQSGNVIFESDMEEKQLTKLIISQIETNFGFSVAVILRTIEELDEIINNCPFSQQSIKEAELNAQVECLYVALLGVATSQEKLYRWNGYESETDEYHISSRDIFLLLHQGIRNSKLAGNIQKLGVPVTVRNLKTLNHIAELAHSLETK